MRNNRKKLRKCVEKERMLWYPRRGGVYFRDVNGEKEMSIVYIDTKIYTVMTYRSFFSRLAGYPPITQNA